MSQYEIPFIFHLDDYTVEETFGNKNVHSAESDETWRPLLEMLKLLGLSGDVPNITAWNGMSEESDPWIPFEHEQYVFSDGMDEASDEVYVNGKHIASTMWSRGTAEMMCDDGRFYTFDGRAENWIQRR